jgi:hypothetical protein
VKNCHALGERRSSQESIIRSLKIGYLKLYGLSAKVFLSPESYGKSNLIDEGCYCTGDYAMEGGLTSAQKRLGQSHLIESLDEEDIQGAASINNDSVELDILSDGADYERVPPRL